MRYGVHKAEAYQACLATEQQQHCISLTQQELNVDVLCDKFEAHISPVAQNTMPQAYKRDGVHAHKHQPCCREALDLKLLCTSRIALQQKMLLLNRSFDL